MIVVKRVDEKLWWSNVGATEENSPHFWTIWFPYESRSNSCHYSWSKLFHVDFKMKLLPKEALDSTESL